MRQHEKASDEKSSFMTGSCLLSVVIPVYNAEKYLTECMESILGQNFFNIEIILVDDGSNDKSGAICDSYEALYSPVVRVIHKKNEGPLIARAKGFEASRGEYVITIDADDAYLPGAFESIAEAIDSTYADVILWGYITGEQLPLESRRRQRKSPYIELKKDEVLHALCLDDAHNAMWKKAIKRSCAYTDFDYGAFAGMLKAEDYLQTVVIYDCAETFCEIPDSLYFYRTNPSGTTRRISNLSAYDDVFAAQRFAEAYAKKWERELRMTGLLDELRIKELRIISSYAINLGLTGNVLELRRFAESDYFLDKYKDCEVRRTLTLVRRITLKLLERQWIVVLRVEAKLVALVRTLRDKRVREISHS